MHHNQFVYDDGDDDDEMFNVRLLGNDRYHGNRVMTDMSGTWRDTTTKFSSKSVPSTISNMAAVSILNWNFVFLDHSRSPICGSITLSKFGVDPIFAVGDIAIL